MHASRPTTVRAALLVLIAAAGAALLPAGPASAADDDVTWTVRTASNDLGKDRTSFDYAVNPGGTVTDALVVANRGDAPLDLAVYAADGYTTENGQLDLLKPGETSHGVGAWVATGVQHVAVEPGATAEVPFTVAVPADATPGDYAGGIVTSLTQPDATEGIAVDRRLGVRIGLRVGGDLAPALAVENLHVTYHGTANPAGSGDATVTYTLHNTGNAILTARQGVALTGPFGWLTVDADAVAAPPELLPGETWAVSVPVHGVAPSVRLAATATVVPVVVDASGSTTALEPVAGTAHTWAVPWAQLALVILAACAVVGAVLLNRRLRARRTAAEDARVQDAVERALASAEASNR